MCSSEMNLAAAGTMVCILCMALLLSQVCCEMNLLDKYWISWKTEFNKKYNNAGEEVFRRSIWQQNVVEVMKHNKGHHSFTMGTNHLSDMTAEEINAKLNGLRMENVLLDTNKNFKLLSDSPVPDRLDWTEKGLVSPVQNQGMCGSCWAFSAAGALEAQMVKKMGRMVPLSAQNLVDCSVKEGNHGCKGGFMTKAFNYVIHNKGIDSDAFYPYQHKEGLCRYSPQGRAGSCSSFQILPQVNESVLLNTVALIGPVSVGINAKLASFHRYRSGIYTDPLCDPRTVNHAVLVVGYGTEGGQDYWLVKNSWGTAWGEKGYVRMARNRNECGIANFAVFPVV
ncbi:procathepsin L isoform X3 [Ictalurus furcatus]|uniref:procathepsin L isoform X3 n=1 Tax=Ictalurus furcatus TaxID=66913 RepID=UPI0023502301|nr:procathepsin L isoform X3 [Ictalurus furcatus]